MPRRLRTRSRRRHLQLHRNAPARRGRHPGRSRQSPHQHPRHLPRFPQAALLCIEDIRAYFASPPSSPCALTSWWLSAIAR
ncbi:hypothetical protein K523DRAFT_167992 [Schizophyllum commune Tattone D]|nr:hypothetical protein K523DRAFT_167992 [Schizophyllum commune Tattone D]